VPYLLAALLRNLPNDEVCTLLATCGYDPA
jgi:hypothetical protein